MTRVTLSNDDFAWFLDEDWIAEPIVPVKSGKEATVYCCKAHSSRRDGFVALKVYTPLAQRGFRDDAIYREHWVLKARPARALRKGTAFGRKVQLGRWLGSEIGNLSLLHAAGADVPEPLAATGKAILMEFVGEGERPAPQLHRVRLPQEEAEQLFEQALRNVEILLRVHLVHGDLSAHNILYHAGRLVLIDLPQAVDARTNSNAERLLRRDIANLCRYFARQGVACDAGETADELWRSYLRAEL